MKSRIRRSIEELAAEHSDRIAEAEEWKAKAKAAGCTVGAMLERYAEMAYRQANRRKVIDGKMECSLCKSYQPLTLFYVHQRKDGYKTYDSRCDPCRKIGMTAKRLKVTPEVYFAIVSAAGGKCEICGEAFFRPSVDHCHKSMRIRGVLCLSCNTALGYMKDDSERLRAAAAYLERYADQA
jgi:hypothetical protein